MDEKIVRLKAWFEENERHVDVDMLALARLITPKDFEMYAEGADQFAAEAGKAFDAGAMLAAAVMIGAAVEAGLLTLAFLQQSIVMQSDIFRNRSFKELPESIAQLQLRELIQLAKRLEWIPAYYISQSWKIWVDQNRSSIAAVLYEKDEAKLGKKKLNEILLDLVRHGRNHIHISRLIRSGEDVQKPALQQICQFSYLAGVELVHCIGYWMMENRHLATASP